MSADQKNKRGGDSPVHVGEWSGVDLRRHKRVHLGVPLECRSGQKVLSGIGENISVGGLLMRVQQTLFAWDEEVTMSFALPGSKEALEIRARVAHVVPDAFLGMEFTEIPSPTRERIENYIATAAAVPPKHG